MEELFGIDLEYEPRGLKGGSGGGGGGRGGGSGGGSGGGTYGGSRGYSDNSGGGNNKPIPLWMIILFPSIICLLFICGCIAKMKKMRGSYTDESDTPGSDTDFDQAVSNAREKQTTSSAANSYSANIAVSNYETYAGDFDIKYEDRGEKRSGLAKIRLENNGNGYKIEGNCSDADGIASINDGFISFTGDGWWVEEIFSGTDSGLKVLTEGKFDFLSNTFAGTWRANNGVRGRYTDFEGNNVSKTLANGAMQSNPQTLGAMLEEDIPTAVATVETPVVAAAPYVHGVPETKLIGAPMVPNPSAPPAYHQVSDQSNVADVYVPRF